VGVVKKLLGHRGDIHKNQRFLSQLALDKSSIHQFKVDVKNVESLSSKRQSLPTRRHGFSRSN
jgi:hypothetical protein